MHDIVFVCVVGGRYMGAPTGVDAEALRLQNEEFKKENEELRSKLQSLTEKVRDRVMYTYACALSYLSVGFLSLLGCSVDDDRPCIDFSACHERSRGTKYHDRRGVPHPSNEHHAMVAAKRYTRGPCNLAPGRAMPLPCGHIVPYPNVLCGKSVVIGRFRSLFSGKRSTDCIVSR